jgi:hypothetical protein
MPERTIKRQLWQLDGDLARDNGPILSTVGYWSRR